MTHLRATLFLLFCFIFTGVFFSGIAKVHANDGQQVQQNQDQSTTQQYTEHHTVTLGVLAIRGDHAARVSWQPTVDFLNQRLTNITVELMPLDLPDIDRAIKNQTIAFLITNPGNSVQLEMKYGISRIASRLPRHAGSPEAVTGTTFFTRADRTDINQLTDLRNKSIMAVSMKAFGGFQIAWHELLNQGIEPFSELSSVRFSHFPLDNIVFSVLKGEVDVGIVKSCLLERMEREGKISLTQLKIINLQSATGFFCKTSSKLYPDWPLAKSAQVPNFIAKEITLAMLSMPAQSRAAIMSRANGWTIPVNYQPLHELMQQLHIGAYRGHSHRNFRDFWQDYWLWLLMLLLALFALISHSWWVNRLVSVRTRQLTQANKRLQQEMHEHQLANDKAKRHQAALAHVQRVSSLGEFASALAHELNQPLTAITSYAEGCIWRLEANKKTDDFLEIAKRIAQQANRAGDVIARIRAFLAKKPPKPKVIHLNQVVSQAVSLFYDQKKMAIERITLNLAPDLPPAWAEIVPIQQVLLNLITNGLDAMATLPPERQSLTISTTYYNEQMLMVKVSDSGLGFSDEIKAHIFEPFITSKAHGMGLGLSICHNLIEQQGGELTLFESSNNGVVIGFTIPINQGEKNNY